MILREARISDIKQIQMVRNSVKENILSNPDLVTDKDCEEFLMERGKGWVCEIENQIIGFVIVDLKENNIWALFIRPEYEKKGIGKRLHDKMLDYYFSIKKEPVWLGTDPDTRAEKFYTLRGWTKVGIRKNGEIKLTMAFENWIKFKSNK